MSSSDLGATAILGGALAGFSGGLGYGTGLQYSYSRGFPAFEAGGVKGMHGTLARDLRPLFDIIGSQTSDVSESLGSALSGVDPVSYHHEVKNKMQSPEDWVKSQRKPKQTASMKATAKRYHDIVKKQVTPQKSAAKVRAEMEISRLKAMIVRDKRYLDRGVNYNSKVRSQAKQRIKDATRRIGVLARVK